MNKCLLRAVIAAGLTFFAMPASTAEPPREAIPVLAGEMHSAAIRRIAVDRDGRYLVSGSHDRTVRVWSLADGKLLRALRPPIGLTADEGQIFAVALSPDGNLVAAGGWTGEWDQTDSIYLFDLQSGQMVRRIGGLPQVVHRLAFSPDGRYLAAALGVGSGIRVFRLAEGELAGEDKDYGAASYGVAWLPGGGLVSVSFDGQVRRYDAAFKRVGPPRKAPGGTEPYSVAVSPDGSRLALGYADSVRVDVLASADLSLLYSADTQGIANGSLSSVSWAADGERLCAGGRYNRDGEFPIVCWEQAGRGARTFLSAGRNSVLGLQPLPGGALAWGSSDPALGVREASGKARWSQGPLGGDFRDATLLVNQDGSGVQVDLREGREPHRFVLGAGGVIAASADAAGFASPRLSAPGLTVTDWKNNTAPKLNGQALALAQYEMSRALAIGPRADQFVLGTEWYLRLFDAKGTRMREIAVPSIARAVNFTGDGRHVVAALADGTLRWYALPTLEERLALYIQPSDLAWVAWTPQGFFDAGKGGEQLIGYQLNQRADQEGVLVRSAQLAEQFRRSDLVSQALNEQGQARIVEAARRLGDVRAVLAAGLPPAVEILSPPGQQTGRDYQLELKVTDRGGGIERIEYRINGTVVGEADARGELANLPGQRPGTIRRPFTLTPGPNDIAVIVTNKRGVASEVARIGVDVKAGELKPSLWVLAVGVSKYRDHDLELHYAADDATALAKVLSTRSAKLFKTTKVTLLTDQAASRKGIEQVFAELAPKIAPEDVFVLHLAGHGVVIDGDYYFVPQEAVYDSTKAALAKASISAQQLKAMLAQISARKSLLLIDTCNSGSLAAAAGGPVIGMRDPETKAAIERLWQATGRATFSASRERQPALEGIDGHGVFTHVLIKGLNGDAAAAGAGARYISIDSLWSYVRREVPRLTLERFKFEQFPMRDLQGDDFEIGVAD